MTGTLQAEEEAGHPPENLPPEYTFRQPTPTPSIPRAASSSPAAKTSKRRASSATAARKKAPAARSKISLRHKREQDEFLTNAGDLLSTTLDYKKTMATVAQLAVPRLAEWCAVEIAHADGTLEEVALAHADPKMISYAMKFRKKYPSDPNAPGGVREVLRTGKPTFYPRITDEMLVQGAKDKEHLKGMRKLRMGGAIVMPLIARGKTLGVITLIARPGRPYTEDDLLFAKRLASRAALAVDNARLYEIQLHYGALVESSSDAIIGKKLDGTIISWNKGAEILYGYTAAEVLGKNISLLAAPGVPHEIPAVLERVAKGQNTGHYETQRKRKDGSILDVSLNVSPIRDADGKVRTASAISRDVTELVRTRNEVLRLNRELEKRVAERTDELAVALAKDRLNLYRLKAMLSHLPFGALMMDDAGNIIELNQRYCDFFEIGLTPEEAMRIPTEELSQRFQKAVVQPDLHMRHVADILVEKRTVFGRDIQLKNGRTIQRDFLAIHDGGKFAGQLFLYRDVTKERRIDAAKTEFMSLASHQLRTPLTGIRWSFGRLAKSLAETASPADKQMLNDGRRASALMSQTIDTMLQISRLQSGDVETNRSSVRLISMFRDLLESYQEKSELRHQKVVLECDGELMMETDERLLREVVANLISNAIKYTPDGGEILLSASRHKKEIVIAMKDSGYGIPAHQQRKVFHKFFRGDNIVSRETDGIGLGLYLVSLLTDLLGGSIDFDSREGEGTTFTLRFPVT